MSDAQPESPSDREASPVDLRAKPTYKQMGQEIGKLVGDKQRAYGDSVGKTGKLLAVLYPDGVSPHQYDDALMTVRILDKLNRIAQRGPEGTDLGGESPYRDIAGYGILGWRKDEYGETK